MTQILSKTFSSMIKIKSFLWKTVLDWCEKQLILLSVYSTTFFSRLNISILCHFLRSSDKLQKNLSSTLYIKICVPYSSATSSMTEVTLIMHFVCQSGFMTRKKTVCWTESLWPISSYHWQRFLSYILSNISLEISKCSPKF